MSSKRLLCILYRSLWMTTSIFQLYLCGLCLCVCLCVYVRVISFACVCLKICACLCVTICLCTCACLLYLCMCICVYVCTCACMWKGVLDILSTVYSFHELQFYNHNKSFLMGYCTLLEIVFVKQREVFVSFWFCIYLFSHGREAHRSAKGVSSL